MIHPKNNLKGMRFGKLVAYEYKHGSWKDATRGRWPCLCDCGRTVEVQSHNLTSGATTSCGCHKSEIVHSFGATRKTHGFSDKERLYNIWLGMKQRCAGTSGERSKKHYFEKGIRVCEEWLNYANFREWSYKNGYYEQPKNTTLKNILSIDRINPDKGYCPENCRWISFSENAKRVNHKKARQSEVKAARDNCQPQRIEENPERTTLPRESAPNRGE